MKAFLKQYAAIGFSWTLVVLLASIASCSDTGIGPNDIGGDGNLDLTKQGNSFPVSISVGSSYDPRFSSFKDSTYIISRDNGIVTFKGEYTFDSTFVRALDTLMGIQSLPQSLKLQAIDGYLKRYGATLDTTDKMRIKVTAQFKAKVTSDGIAEFFSSKGDISRPHTIVKYGWNVGDSYSFTTDDGAAVKRTVVSKSVNDDYPVGFWLLKTIQVEETVVNDPLLTSIRYVGNHKYGLVGIKVTTQAGKVLNITVFPPTL